MTDKIRIYGELENHTENGYVTDASQVKDTINGEIKSQAWINDDLYKKSGNSSANTAYIVCDTSADVANKKITLDGFELTTSLRILIEMTNENTASNVKLLINDENPFPILYNGSLVSAENTWKSGEVLDTYFDGSNFIAATYGSAQFKTGERVIDLGIDEIITADSENLITSGAVNNKFTEVDENLLDLDRAVFPLSVSLDNTTPVNPVQEYTGVNIPVVINWTTIKKGKGDVVVESIVIEKNGTTISTQTPESSSGSINDNINTLGSTEFSVTATLNGVNTTETKVYTQYLPSYIGFYDGNNHTVIEMINGTGKLTKRVVSDVDSLSGGPFVNNKEVPAYFTICVPSTFTISLVMDARTGFEIPMQSAVQDTSVQIKGETMNYSIYRSADPVNVGSSINVTIY